MEDSPTYRFEQIDLNGLLLLVQWAKQEGWNPGLGDAVAFYNTDPNGFYGYFDGDDMIGGGSLVSYNGAFGFMGFFIVKPTHRGMGIGRQLWLLRRDTLLAGLRPGAVIGMDGVVAMQSFYQSGGFEIAFRDERYVVKGQELTLNPHISTINEADFQEVHSLDVECFGFDRKAFLKHWLSMPSVSAFKYSYEGTLLGFAVVRQVTHGYKIGPLFANDLSIADALYQACLNEAAGQDVFLDIPLVNSAAIELVKSYQAQYVFECARMYYGQAPTQAWHKVFGITSFELG